MKKNNQYITIQGWMGKGGLNLSGSSLIIYAIIYGFSQDGESACSCHLQYFQEWADVCERTARDIVSSLAASGYILRNEIGTGRGSYVEYRANMKIAEDAQKGANFAPIIKGANNSEKGANFAGQNNNNIIIYNNYFLRDARAMEDQRKEFFNFFFWKNANAPKAEMEAFCRVAELADWKDSKGRKLDTFRKRIIWADGWEIKQGKERVNPYFLAVWNEIYKELLRAGDPMADQLIDTRIRVTGTSKDITLSCSKEIMDWIENDIAPQGRSSRIYNLITSFMKGRKLHYQPFVLWP